MKDCSLVNDVVSYVKGWIYSFLGLKNNAVFSDIKAMERANSTELAHLNILYNHIYYFSNSDGSKKIVAVKDLKDIDEDSNIDYRYAIFTYYNGFNLGLCDVFNVGNDTEYRTHKSLSAGSHSELTCGVFNSTLAMLLIDDDSANNFWPDFTSRIRPR